MSFKYGDVIPAGLFLSTVIADMDFETYCEAGLELTPVIDKRTGAELLKWKSPHDAPGTKKGLGLVGMARYCEHPSFEVLTLSYDLKDGRGPRVWVPGRPLPLDLFEHLTSGKLIEAWNVGFEYYVWQRCIDLYGFPAFLVSQWRCAQAKARAFSYPGGLGLAGQVMGLSVTKDKGGGTLLDKYSVPRNPTKTDPRLRNRLEDDFLDAAKMVSYNITDIQVEAEASRRCPDLVGPELEFWQIDQAINRRGVQIDVEGVHNCIAVLDQLYAQYNEELRHVTGGVVQGATKLKDLTNWLHGLGVHMDSLDEDHINEALKNRDSLPVSAVRALEIRQIAGSASVKKVYALKHSVCRDGRARDLYNYHGARTGRPTGEGAQPTNLPRKGCTVAKCTSCGKHYGYFLSICPWCSVIQPPKKRKEDWGIGPAEDVLEILKTRSLSTLQKYFEDAGAAISGVLRSLFVAAEGKVLLSSDFSAIEAAVIAVLAGEQWRIDVFNSHGMIYEMSASKTTGVPLEEFIRYKKENGQHHPFRQSPGKISELALGYGGGVTAWRNFDGPGTDDEVKKNILDWREASPNVEFFWGGQPGKRVPPGILPLLPAGMYRQSRGGSAYFNAYFGLEGMAVLAIKNPGSIFPVQRLNGTFTGISYTFRDGILYCILPSGRTITYHNARLCPPDASWKGEGIKFEGYNTNPAQGPIGWVTMSTYSGKLAENVTQAVARDWQREAVINLERNGYPVVLHIYDEDVCEVPEDDPTKTVEGLEELMMRPPPWGAGWPIKAKGGWRGKRYRKE